MKEKCHEITVYHEEEGLMMRICMECARDPDKLAMHEQLAFDNLVHIIYKRAFIKS